MGLKEAKKGSTFSPFTAGKSLLYRKLNRKDRNNIKDARIIANIKNDVWLQVIQCYRQDKKRN